MKDRRKGTTWGWLLWFRFIIGERRKGERRDTTRQSMTEAILSGCGGDCNQGRHPCNCK